MLPVDLTEQTPFIFVKEGPITLPSMISESDLCFQVSLHTCLTSARRADERALHVAVLGPYSATT